MTAPDAKASPLCDSAYRYRLDGRHYTPEGALCYLESLGFTLADASAYLRSLAVAL